MTFEEWLESDEGVVMFGLKLRPQWIADARIVWDAAIEAAASAADLQDCDQTEYDCGTTDRIVADIRALSSNETTNV